MSTGVPVAQECIDAYQNLKKKGIKAEGGKYVIYRLNHDFSEIVVEKESDNPDYEDFLQNLPPNEPRYGVYDYIYNVEDGGVRNKLMFIKWSPDIAKVKYKMTYAGSSDGLRKRLDGISAEIQATDESEISLESVIDKLKRTSK